jgi:hypothetical protein
VQVASAQPINEMAPVAPAPKPVAKPVVKPVTKPVAVAQPAPMPEPAPAPKPVVQKPTPVAPVAPKPVEPTTMAMAKPDVEPTPTPVAKPAPVPAPTPAPVVKPAEPAVVTPSPAPKPIAQPVVTPKPAAPVAKPVATPVPQPAIATATNQAPVVSPVMPVKTAMDQPAPKSNPNPERMVSNTSLSASDGFLSRRHQVTSTERNYEPIHAATPVPAEMTMPLPTMEQLVRDGKAYDARIVLKQVNGVNLAMLAEAVRIIIKDKPRNGAVDLYDVVREAKPAAPRAMAIDALFQAYPQNATYSAQKLLAQTRYNRIDRLVVGNRIMQYRINRTYAAAITNLGYDASGKAFFDARRGILAADKAVTQELKNYAALASTKHAGFVANRLYHWIRNDDTIEQAYEDTFVKHPSELGTIMFRERFGEEALTSLQKAQGEVDRKLQPIVARELAKITDKSTSPALMFGYHKLYLITYQTPQGNYTLLSDQAIWPDQAMDEMYQQTDATSSFTQKVLTVKADELAQIKKLPQDWKSGVQVQGVTVDTIDLK